LNILQNIKKKDFVGLVFGSHYIAKEVYSGFGKHFDTTYN